MENMLKLADKVPAGASFAILAIDRKSFRTSLLTQREKAHLKDLRTIDPERRFFIISRYAQKIAVAFLKEEEDDHGRMESCRRHGSSLSDLMAEYRITTICLTSTERNPSLILAFAEGLALSSYRFLSYFSEKNAKKQAHPLTAIHIHHPLADEGLLQNTSVRIKYTCMARDLVNEPPSAMSAMQFARKVADQATTLSIKAEVLSKARIEALKMGGILAVNRGSVDPPAFIILEWKPEGALNAQPVILVGKGVIFDTGGMNLKTGSFMDGMKSDMAGAALVVATIMAAAELSLPLHVIALVPATDNRVDGNALLPGDVITMHDGTTVEVKNTDAEGRLILADAISYANRYKPQLILDAATLTGSAMRAIGHYGIVAMHQRAAKPMELLKDTGLKVHERIAEFPMWDEYDEQLKSDIADMANLGGANGGAVVAAKFLARFTRFPFIHLDIAGPAFTEKQQYYIPKGGTGTGVRLLVTFLEAFAGAIQ